MPVIVVGADTGLGRRITDALLDPNREVRVFVSDEAHAEQLRQRGAKVALGDVSDDSHIEGAATRCFTAILVTEAATDDRERSFADSERKVLEAWARGVAGVQRVIWVHDGEVPPVSVEEAAQVSPVVPDVVERVVELDDLRTLAVKDD